MSLVLGAIGVLFVFALAALALSRSQKFASILGAAGPVIAAPLALIPACQVLLLGGPREFTASWDVPLGSFHLLMDGLSAMFVLPIAVISALAAVYGWRYLLPYRGKKNLATSWFFYNVLVASMMLVVLARNGVLFLVAWEVMSVASFFLVMFDDHKESVRQAGWTYLVATHIGTAFLLAMFFLLGRAGSTMEFDQFVGAAGGPMAGVVFLLGLVGFGTKAGLMPMHVWLPEAHPAAPSHVSAVMSGVMIKTGIYGICRTLTFLPAWQEWWGWTLVGVGAIGGILGVLYAMAQHDLKRMLAYHSVENIGIITLGLGLGVLGSVYSLPLMSALGFAGALLHVINHSIFKSLLFMAAGSVQQASKEHCLDMDQLGGLIKKMPAVSVSFLIASLAIVGLPPLNGFVSEFLIYLGGYQACLAKTGNITGAVIAGMAAIAGLAMMGGLAAACFAKAFGICFLGQPRHEELTSHATDAPWPMRLAMLVLAAACIAIGLMSPMALRLPQSAVAIMTSQTYQEVAAKFNYVWHPMWKIVAASSLLMAALVLLIALRGRLLSRRVVVAGPTWDCGYAKPTARMQYTASSFVGPITNMFRKFLGLTAQTPQIQGLFPVEAAFSSTSRDRFLKGVFEPAFRGVAHISSKLAWLQQGRIQLYVLYIALTLLILLVWKLL